MLVTDWKQYVKDKFQARFWNEVKTIWFSSYWKQPDREEYKDSSSPESDHDLQPQTSRAISADAEKSTGTTFIFRR